MFLFNFLGVYKHYDGIIWAEILDYIALGIGKKGWFSFLTRRNRKKVAAASSDEHTYLDVKSMTDQTHLDFRNEALNLYLNDVEDVLCGVEPINDPVNVINQVYTIYASLHNSYLSYDNHETNWKYDEFTEVLKYSFYY